MGMKLIDIIMDMSEDEVNSTKALVLACMTAAALEAQADRDLTVRYLERENGRLSEAARSLEEMA